MVFGGGAGRGAGAGSCYRYIPMNEQAVGSYQVRLHGGCRDLACRLTAGKKMFLPGAPITACLSKPFRGAVRINDCEIATGKTA